MYLHYVYAETLRQARPDGYELRRTAGHGDLGIDLCVTNLPQQRRGITDRIDSTDGMNWPFVALYNLSLSYQYPRGNVLLHWREVDERITT